MKKTSIVGDEGHISGETKKQINFISLGTHTDGLEPISYCEKLLSINITPWDVNYIRYGALSY